MTENPGELGNWMIAGSGSDFFLYQDACGKGRAWGKCGAREELGQANGGSDCHGPFLTMEFPSESVTEGQRKGAQRPCEVLPT